MYALDSTTETIPSGESFRVEIVHDDGMGMPWNEFDGHGVVSDWDRRPKKPGEVILTGDRREAIFYDVQASTAIALRDGWCASTVDAELLRVGSISKREAAHRAVLADIVYCRKWATGESYFVGVVVTPLDIHGNEMKHRAESLWGIESNDREYIREVAFDLINQCAQVTA